ncbi:MAG TPA: lipopolysaccharide kinase InaA family protein [Victivallales bacterium]|nr:lipopolysaccharide kinase InaA family protein [Victivallales bacterium]
MDTFNIEEKFRTLLSQNKINSAEKLWALSGENAKKETKARQIQKIILKSNNSDEKCFYLKRYFPLPLTEIIKNKICFKPVFRDGAIHEWNAIKKFKELNLNVPEPVAVAKFANGNSCILTKGIENYVRASEILSKNYNINEKRRKNIISQIARITGIMHSANSAHQDLYLLHFFVIPEEDDKIYLIDLQRAIISPKQFSVRWIIKDLSQLFFSAEEIFTEAEKELFRVEYSHYVQPELLEKLLPKVLRKINTLRKKAKKKIKNQ